MHQWQLGYQVHVVGHGYVRDIGVRRGWIVFTDDQCGALTMETFRDAQLVQHWVLNILEGAQVGIAPFVSSLPGEV